MGNIFRVIMMLYALNFKIVGDHNNYTVVEVVKYLKGESPYLWLWQCGRYCSVLRPAALQDGQHAAAWAQHRAELETCFPAWLLPGPGQSVFYRRLSIWASAIITLRWQSRSPATHCLRWIQIWWIWWGMCTISSLRITTKCIMQFTKLVLSKLQVYHRMHS